VAEFKLDFAGIGIAKSGTTWLAACLKQYPGFSPPSLMKRVNPRTMVKSKRLRDLRFAINRFLQSNAVTRFLRKVLSKLRVGEMVLRLFQKNEKAAAAPPMPAETRAWLVQTYPEDNERLGAFLGRDLSHWNR